MVLINRFLIRQRKCRFWSFIGTFTVISLVKTSGLQSRWGRLHLNLIVNLFLILGCGVFWGVTNIFIFWGPQKWVNVEVARIVPQADHRNGQRTRLRDCVDSTEQLTTRVSKCSRRIWDKILKFGKSEIFTSSLDAPGKTNHWRGP